MKNNSYIFEYFINKCNSMLVTPSLNRFAAQVIRFEFDDSHKYELYMIENSRVTKRGPSHQCLIRTRPLLEYTVPWIQNIKCWIKWGYKLKIFCIFKLSIKTDWIISDPTNRPWLKVRDFGRFVCSDTALC